ncbi:MAG: UbiA family prenyltransferase [Phycisphaerales bacterium]|nr:MAG: UbiA family prenyltransferase [Phycisphaerales bacterium]
MRPVISSARVWAEMVKLSHSIFALPFALMAAFLAGRNIEGRGWPYWGQLGLIVICMVSARSVAMTFNRIVDAEIDARNPRTARRPLPAGRLTRSVAWAMLGLSAVTFGIGCLGFYVFFHNTWPILLSGPVLVFLCGYSFTKRFTKWSHYFLGMALALSPLGAWLAIHPTTVGLPVVLLMVGVTCWVAGFDIIYACQDIDVDRRDGLYSLPSRLGPAPSLWIARGSHLLAIVCLAALGFAADLGLIYAIGVVIAAILLIVENSLVRPGHYSKVNLAFFTINGIVSVVLGILAVTDMVLTLPTNVA